MKKIIKKVVSCILSFVFILTPLMFTGCMDVITNLLLEEYLSKLETKVEPTYYVGGMYSNDVGFVYSEALTGYRNGWKNKTSNLIEAFNQEFGTTENKGDRNISGESGNIFGRVDYFPDYRTLFRNDSTDEKFPTDLDIAKKLHNYCYAGYYIEGDCVVLVLSTTNLTTTESSSGGISYTISGLFSRDSGSKKFDSRLFAVEDNKFIAKLEQESSNNVYNYRDFNLTSYSGTTKEDLKQGTVLYDMSTETDYKVFSFSCKMNGNTSAVGCSFLIGNKSSFINTFDDTSTVSQSLSESIANFLSQLYDTHYGLGYNYWGISDTYIHSPGMIFEFKHAQENINSNLTSGNENRLTVDILKALLVGDETELLKNYIPTSIYKNELTKSIRCNVEGDFSGITSITLYDIYNAVLEERASSETTVTTIKDEKNKEIIEVEAIDENDIEDLFIICTYQFFNGIIGIKGTSDDWKKVSNVIIKGTIYKNYKDYTEKFTTYISGGPGVKIASSTIFVPLKAIVAYLNNRTDRNINVNSKEYTRFPMATVTGLEIDSGKGDNYDDFFSAETRKYYSLTFEAWGKDYEMYGITFQIDYLTEEEKTAGVTSNNWEKIRDHYTIVVERCVYAQNEASGTKRLTQTHLMSIKASELFSDSEIEEGFFFLNFEDVTKESSRNTIKDLSLCSVISDTRIGRDPISDIPFSVLNSRSYNVREYYSGGDLVSMAYSHNGYELEEEYIQLIFAVDNEAYRIPFRITAIAMG